jgi:hypothetical protein
MHKLYKLTVEYQIVVAAESVKDAEKSASEIMITHANDILLTENVGYVLAEPISDAGDLPKSWTTNCLPYTKYSSYTIPQELEDKTIEELL